MRIFVGSTRRAALVVSVALVTALATTLAGCTATSNSPDFTTGSTPEGPSRTQNITGSGLIPPDDSNTGATVTTDVPSPSTTSPVDVLGLSWMTGSHTDQGIVIDSGDEKHWYGQTPGEHAVLQGSAYQWFGPDGSIVGCTSHGSCVGVDSDGNIAVRVGDDGPRNVYDPTGKYLGRYASDDAPVADPVVPLSVQQALVRSGVNVANLVDNATAAAPFAGGATGDPHLITGGGQRFSTQATGQFVARSGDKDHQIQLQFHSMEHRDDVSIISHVAIGANGDTIDISSDGTLTVNGFAPTRKPAFTQTTLPSGVVIGRWPTDAAGVTPIVVVWPDGGSVAVAARPALGITIVAHLYPDADSAGLFGNALPANNSRADLQARSGKADDTSSAVGSWRVRADESLFGEPADQVTGSTDKPPDLDAGAKKSAQAMCHGHGIESAEDLSACVFDVALTGDAGFVSGHAQLAQPAENHLIADSFAKRWPALVLSGVGSANALPAGGRLDMTMSAGDTSVFTLALDRAEQVTAINREGCAVGQSPPGFDRPAMRIFDAAGHPVSDRFALCGHQQSPELAAGDYYLMVARGPDASELEVRADIKKG